MNNCIVCKNETFNHIYHNTLLKCSACGFITTNLEINEEKLKSIYSENYFKGEEYLDYLSDKTAIQKNFHKRLLKIKLTCINHYIENVLEIGCAYGFFAESFTKTFPDAEYIGIDIVNEAISYGREKLQQNLFIADYLNFKALKPYSDVFMWDVIEHLPEPQKFIEKISLELVPGGRLYITTGDIGALMPKIQRNKWRMIHPPTHLHYFSSTTLKKLLENNGFKIMFISYPPLYRSVKQIFYSLFILNKKERKFFNKLFLIIPDYWQIPINTYDIMFVGAMKVND